MFAIGTGAFIASGILPDIKSEFGVPLSATSQVVIAYALTYGVSAPVLASISTRRPERLVLVSMGLFAIANIAAAAAPNFLILLMTRIAAGLSAAVFTPAAYALATRVARSGRSGGALSAVSMGVTLSSVVGIPAGIIIAQQFGARATFASVAMIAAFSALGLYFVVFDRVHPVPLDRGTPRVPIEASAMLVFVPALCWCTANHIIFTYLAVIFSEHYSKAQVVSFYIVFGIGAVVGGKVGGWSADRMGSTVPIVLALCVSLVNQAAFGILSQYWIGVNVVMFVWSFSFWIIFTPQQMICIRRNVARASLMIALNNSTIYFASALGATLGAYLLSLGFKLSSFHWFSFSLLLVALIFFILHRIAFQDGSYPEGDSPMTLEPTPDNAMVARVDRVAIRQLTQTKRPPAIPERFADIAPLQFSQVRFSSATDSSETDLHREETRDRDDEEQGK